MTQRHKVASIIRTRFLRADFRQYFVKILVNPRGFTVFCVLSCQKSATQKIADPKVRIFAEFLDGEDADRLPPFKSEAPKSRENSRFWAGSDYTRHPTRKGRRKQQVSPHRVGEVILSGSIFSRIFFIFYGVLFLVVLFSLFVGFVYSFCKAFFIYITV